MNYGQRHNSLKVQKHFAFFVNVFNNLLSSCNNNKNNCSLNCGLPVACLAQFLCENHF